jgi:16S rRNA (uracil1498-N3)-methyltransferase
VPEVLPVVGFHAWLGSSAPASAALRLTLAPGASVRLAEVNRPQGTIVLLAGPEGGLAPREHADAQAAGFTSIRLGPRVLRTETAAVAALAAVQALWGDF